MLFFYFLLILFLVYAILNFIFIFLFFRRKQTHIAGSWLPVSILKPVKGLDQGALENFSSYCEVDYPKYEVIFCVQSDADPVIPLVKKIIQKYPNKDISLVISNDHVGSNAKVNNLHNGYQKAKYDFIVYNDSDTRVTMDYLQKIIPPLLDSKVGAVTAIPVYRESQNWVAGLETIGMNADSIPGFAPVGVLGKIDFCIGATIALRRQVLEEIGGFKALAHNICDDGLIGKKIIERGYKIHLSNHLVSCIHHESSFADYYAHMMRWFSTIRSFMPSRFFIIGIFLLCPLACFPLMVLRIGLGALLNYLYIGDQSTYRYIWLLPFRDCVLAWIWIKAWVTNRICWRGSWYQLKWGGVIVSEQSADFLTSQTSE